MRQFATTIPLVIMAVGCILSDVLVAAEPQPLRRPEVPSTATANQGSEELIDERMHLLVSKASWRPVPSEWTTYLHFRLQPIGDGAYQRIVVWGGFLGADGNYPGTLLERHPKIPHGREDYFAFRFHKTRYGYMIEHKATGLYLRQVALKEEIIRFIRLRGGSSSGEDKNQAIKLRLGDRPSGSEDINDFRFLLFRELCGKDTNSVEECGKELSSVIQSSARVLLVQHNSTTPTFVRGDTVELLPANSLMNMQEANWPMPVAVARLSWADRAQQNVLIQVQSLAETRPLAEAGYLCVRKNPGSLIIGKPNESDVSDAAFGIKYAKDGKEPRFRGHFLFTHVKSGSLLRFQSTHPESGALVRSHEHDWKNEKPLVNRLGIGPPATGLTELFVSFRLAMYREQ